MNAQDLKTALSNATHGSLIRVDYGEFQGPWEIAQPIQVLGTGMASVLWAPDGPVLTIRAPHVTLEDISIEVSTNPNGIAIQIDPSVWPHGPRFKNVRVFGKVEGLEGNQHWRVPALIDFGRITSRPDIKKSFSVEVPSTPNIVSSLPGLLVRPRPDVFGSYAFELILDGTQLREGCLLDGELRLESGGLLTDSRIVGQVVAENQSDSQSSPPTTGASVLMGMSGPTPAPRRVLTAEQQPNTLEPTQQTWTEEQLAVAREAINNQQADLAITQLLQVIGRDPQSLEPHELLANLYVKRNRFDLASASWERVRQIRPDHPKAHLKLANCYIQMSQSGQAVALLEGIFRDPVRRDHELFDTLAAAYHASQRFDEALWALDEAEKQRPDIRRRTLRKIWSSHLVI